MRSFILVGLALSACTTPPPSAQIGHLDPVRFALPASGAEFTSVPFPAPLPGALPPDLRACLVPAPTTPASRRIAACTAAIASGTHPPASLSNAHQARSRAHLEAGDLPRAMADAEAALRLAPDAPYALLQRAVVQERRGDLRAALADFDAAITREPGAAAPRLLRGLLHLRAGRHDAALADADVAIRTSAAAGHLLRGLALRAMRKPDAALVDVEAAMRLAPGRVAHRALRAHLKLDLRDYAGAAADYDAVLAQAPDMVSARVGRGAALLRLARLPDALDDLDRAVTLAPDNAAARNQRGLAHARMGNRVLAIADHAEAARLDPTVPQYAENRRLLEAGFVTPRR